MTGILEDTNNDHAECHLLFTICPALCRGLCYYTKWVQCHGYPELLLICTEEGEVSLSNGERISNNNGNKIDIEYLPCMGFYF